MVIGFITWGCSSDDDGGTERVAGGSDARPTWQVPNYDHYEQIMVVEVQLQDILQTYASATDMMCASVNGEVRGVTTPKQVGDQWKFPLIIASNDAGVNIQLSVVLQRSAASHLHHQLDHVRHLGCPNRYGWHL